MQSLHIFAAKYSPHAGFAERPGRAVTILAALGGPLNLILSIGAERVI